MSAVILRGDARTIPLADTSVDLIVTSPPYFGLRSYQDGGEHYDGQIGAEATPREYVAALLECTREWMRVLKPEGSLWVNLGDAFSRGQRLDSGFTAQDAAWLAGVIDSDGSISIRVDNSGRSHIAWTRVGQMRREVVEQIGAVTKVGKVWQDGRGVWNWSAAAQQARWVLERIWPWLHIKRNQALAAVDLMTQKAEGKHKGRWNMLTDNDLRQRELIRQAVLAWNRGEDFPDYEPPVVALPKLPREPQLVPAKSLLGLPWRYALGCIDDLGLILRAEVIWSKPNGLPESVTDRVRRSHEAWFHLVKSPRYFAAVDEIREAYLAPTATRTFGRVDPSRGDHGQPHTRKDARDTMNPLGKLPGSVWEIATQPLKVPAELAVDHFAAFPMEWPRRIISGWSPSGICTACGEGRRPVATSDPFKAKAFAVEQQMDGGRSWHGRDPANRALGIPASERNRRITGYTCACPDTSASTRPAVVLDPFGGTGTVALVADVLGRHGVSVDRSADYGRLAHWRTADPGERARALGLPKPPPVMDGQGDLFDVAS